MRTSTFTTIINSSWGWYSVVDPGGVYYDAPGARPGNPPPPGGANGLVGMDRPWGGTIVTGTKYGPVRVTAEVHDSRPPAADVVPDYTDVVEVDFTVVSGQVVLADWDGEAFHTLTIPSGAWRLRVHARGRKEGAAREWDPFDPEDPDTELVEEHLLQLFPGPGPKLGEVVILP